MKRILILLLVLTLTVGMFAGCDMIQNVIGGFGQPGDETPDNGTEEDPKPAPDYLPDAVTFLHNIYKEKSELTPKDFDVIASVTIDGVKFDVTWTSDNENVVITESSKVNSWRVDILPLMTEEEFTYTLTATVSAADGRSEQKSYTFKVPVLTGIVSAPEEGVAYKISFNQIKLGKRLFALNKSQDNKNKFILASNDPKEAADFFVEKVDNGYKFYTEVDGVKTYVFAKTETSSDGKVSKFIGFSTEEGSVFYYEECGAWRTNVNGLDYGFGTYNDFATLSISDWSYFSASSVGSTQFVAEFIPSEYAESLTPEETPTVEEPADGSTLTIEEAIDLGLKVISTSNGKFYVTGKVSEISNSTYGNMYIVDEAGNKLQLYGTYSADGSLRFDAMENKPAVGDTITVYGTVGNYNNAAQMKNSWIITIVPGEGGSDTPVDPETPDEPVTPPATDSAKVELTVDSLGIPSQNYTASTATVGGVAFEWIQLGNYGDGLQMRDKDGKTSMLWNTSAFAAGIKEIQLVYSSSKDTYDNPDAVIFTFGNEVKGATFSTKLSTVKGTKTYTITPDSDTYTYFYLEHDYSYSMYWASITIVLADGTTVNPETPVDPQPPVHEHNFVEGKCECGETDPNYVAPEAPAFGVVDPVAGTAYKFGMVQGNLQNAIYYLKGGMDGYYMATTTDVNAAIDVYLEETTGGYYLYTLNADGSKLYINMVVSGTHVNGAYEATATTVYTYNAESKTIIAVVNDADYWFGTRNDKTYTTAGPCAVSYAGFYCQFYGATATDTPVDPQPPVHEHNFVEGKCECGETDPNYVAPNPPAEKTIITIPEALAIAKAQGDTYTTEKYYITGTVTKITNTFFGNFYLVDAEGNELYVYGLKDATGAGNFEGLNPQPAVGDTLTIYTVLGCYKGAPQAKDAWFDALVQHTEHTYAPATCKVAATCTICGKTDGEPLEHTYVDGTCTGCGKSEPVQGTVITSTESFAGLTASGSYKTVTTTSGWTATNAAVLTGGASDQNPVFQFIGSTADTVAITLNGKTSAVGKLTSATLENGISKLSFNYGHAFSDSNGVDITINILKNGEVVATTKLDNDSVAQKTAYEFTWELDKAVEGDFVIEILNNSPSNSTSNKDRIAIFNVSWDSAPIVEG